MLKQKLSFNFYIVIAVMVLCIVIFPYGIYGILSGTLVNDNGGEFNTSSKVLLTFIGSAATVFSLISIIPAIRQAMIGYAFIIDDQGIHSTLSVFGVKTYPYDAHKKNSL